MEDQLEESSTALAGGSEHEGPTRGEFHCSSWRTTALAVNMEDQLEESSTALAGGSEHGGPTRGEFHCSSWRQ